MQDETGTTLNPQVPPPGSSADHDESRDDNYDDNYDDSHIEDGLAPSLGPPSSVEASTARPNQVGRRRLFVGLVAVAVLAYATDQVSKLIALDLLADGQSRPLLGDFLRLKLIGNPGAALSLGAGNTWVMTVIAAVVLVAIIFVARDLGSRAWAIALGALLGSALGNLTDRFTRPPGGGQGHVVDFLDYNGWFIGNVADIWIVAAAILIVLLAILGVSVDGRREHGRSARHGEHSSGGSSDE
jgi:signal peptidase II